MGILLNATAFKGILVVILVGFLGFKLHQWQRYQFKKGHQEGWEQCQKELTKKAIVRKRKSKKLKTINDKTRQKVQEAGTLEEKMELLEN